MIKNIDWDAGHSPITGTLNAAYTAFTAAAVGHEAGLPTAVVAGASIVGAAGAAIAGGSHEPRLSGGSIALRVGAWLAGGGWVSYALTQESVWSWSVVGPMLATACGFGSLAGALGAKRSRELKRAEEAHSALFRVKTGGEWIERIERVCGIPDCEIPAVEQWKGEDGKETGAGYDVEVRLPLGGHSWRSIQMKSEGLAADARLPEGCGITVRSGNGRDKAIISVQLVNSLLDTKNVPHDASELSFEESFDIGVARDGGLATVNIREFSMMVAGAKRTGKTNELLTIMTRLLRMPNLLVWVIDFNGGGVALQWLRAWDQLGRPGRPPIDWVASTKNEAAMMAEAGVRIAKERKMAYQQLMADKDTDLLPMSPEIPGIVIITDEGAEVYANPQHRVVAEPMKEVLRIAGSSGVNQINCFLRATADTTGDTIIKSQSKVRVGMRMADDQEISYLLGWRSGVLPEDMPDRGYGALSEDESVAATVFRGWRTLPSDIKWFVENTACYRQNKGLDDVSLEAAGAPYKTRWDDSRAGYVFGKSGATVTSPAVSMTKEEDGSLTVTVDDTEDFFGGRPPVDPDEARANLQKAIADAPEPAPVQDEFERVMAEAGAVDLSDPSSWPDGQRPVTETPEEDEEPDSLKDVVFGLIKSMSPDGIAVGEIVTALQGLYGDDAPVRETVHKWLRTDERYWRPTGRKLWAVKPEEMN